MIIRLSPGQCEFLERDDLKRLKLCAPHGWDEDDIQRDLPFKVTFVPSHIWMQEADLRELYPSEPQAQAALTAMIDKAKAFGFYDENAKTVRLHIEYN